jgi:hypothetical protein
LLQALRGEGPAETTGEDNVKTLKLVFAAYKSARNGKVVELGTAQQGLMDTVGQPARLF